jgi:hypothetical protein
MGITNGLNPDNIKQAFKTINQSVFKHQKQDHEFYKYKGFWSWFRNMVMIDDAMTKKACSSDAYVYLLYLKRCAIFLFILSIVGVGFLCPFYYFGKNNDNSTFLENLTVFEIIHSKWKIWIMFTISLAYSVLGYYFVYNLIIPLKDFRYYKEQNDTLSEDYYVSKKTVMITGISDDLSVDKSNKLLNSVLESRYGIEYKEARTLGRYNNLYKLLKERIDIASKLNDLMAKLYFNGSKFIPYICSRYSIYIGIEAVPVITWAYY